jgi:hypothetical protein
VPSQMRITGGTEAILIYLTSIIRLPDAYEKKNDLRRLKIR